MKKNVPLLLLTLLLLCGGQTLRAEETEAVPSLAEEEVTLTVPGLSRPYRLLWVSDLHIGTSPDDADVDAAHEEEVAERCAMYAGADGRTSAQLWQEMAGALDAYEADALILGGDMIDYASGANLDALQAGLEPVETPWMYLRADHDYGRWFGSLSLEQMRALQREVAPQEQVWVQELDELLVVGLDNTTSALSEEAIGELEQLCEQGKPVILCMHVPVDRLPEVYFPEWELPEEVTLADVSKQGWADRVLCWGDGDAYDTAKSTTMQRLVELLARPDSPIAAVLAGHLHLSWDGMITPACREHVFSPAFAGNVGVITVAP